MSKKIFYPDGKDCATNKPLFCLLALMCIGAGGFYTEIVGICSIFLMIWLFFVQNGRLKFVFNPFSTAILVCFAFYCISPFWAADRAMAWLGPARFLPVVLCLLLFMQKKFDQQEVFRDCVLIGAGMSVVSLIGSLIPGLQNIFTVAGRLSGTFGYPNTFAAFLTVCLVFQSTKNDTKKSDWGINTILSLGLLASGSRGGFVWAAVMLLACLCIYRKKALPVILPLLGVIGCAYLAELAGFSSEANRYLTASGQSGTFLARLLYYKDALGECLSHPFGIGYWGYRVTLPTFQTGRYAVSFVHNDLLQMLLEIGWIPTLGLIFGIGWLFFKQNARNRLLLVAIVGHSMIDFDAQFLIIWVLLLALCEIACGKTVKFRGSKILACAAMLVSLWFSAGELLFRADCFALCNSLAPWHTEAKVALLTEVQTADEMQHIADDILDAAPKRSIAHAALAEVAYSKGSLTKVIDYKTEALVLAPYEIAEYVDYLNKLFAFYNRYAEMNDPKGTDLCIREMQNVCKMLEQVEANTDPLAVQSGEDQSMELPQEYREVLAELGVFP